MISRHRMTGPGRAGLALSLLSLISALPLFGQEEDPSPHSEASLVSEVTSIRPGTPFTVGVHFELEEEWHNYWQNAGDSGLPTTIEWTLPAGFRAGEIQWPVPSRIVVPPLVDYGYSDQVTLLVEITPPADLAPGSRVTLDALVDWLICREICLPAYQELSLEVPVDSAEPTPDPDLAPLFTRARESLPDPMEPWEADAELTDGGYRLHIRTTEEGLDAPGDVYFYPSGESVLDHAAPQEITPVEGGIALELTGSAFATGPTRTLEGVLVAEGGGSWDGAGEVTAIAVRAPVAGVPRDAQGQGGGAGTGPDAGAVSAQGGEGPEAGLTLALALVFAFFGGVLLNLMPCVFPVLSIKLLGTVGHGGGNRARARNDGLVFGLGVVVSFLALAGALIALRAGGAQLGWGFQLQSPIFVAGMAALFFAIGLNLMGVFEVGTSLTRLGAPKPGASGGYGESLASGVLATVIATPCTAPFMGAALGFALTRSMAETLLIFGFLGVGMAMPYVVLSVAPGLLEKLPRPGPWMETLKNVLAFPMFATVIWLVWVFGQQTGIGGTANLLTAFLLLGAAGWMVGRWHRTDLRSGRVARVASLATLALAVFFVVRGSAQEAALAAPEEGWQAFSEEAVSSTLAQGRPAFVDFTAAWCLTCQVNERVVLNTERIQNAFRERDVALFKADWTRQDPAITAALEKLGRSGVPVYVLYQGHVGAEPHILPAILTDQIVLDALDRVLSQ